MKRKLVCLIDENIETTESLTNSLSPMTDTLLRQLLASDIECWREGNARRVRVKLNGGEELAEEWSTTTNCLIRRAWRTPGLRPLGAEVEWQVELGEPPPPQVQATVEFREASDQPVITRRSTRINLEWRIRNLPYPIEVYSVAANQTENCLIVKTTNKKYYKKLKIPEIERIGITPVQANVSFIHKFNTLIITYKKPAELTDFEKRWFEELSKIEKPENSVDGCKTS